MKRISFILLLFIPLWQLNGQELMDRDSLLRLLPKVKEDSNKVLLYISLGQQYEGQEPETAKFYYQAAGELSRQIDYVPGIIKYIMNYTFILNQQGGLYHFMKKGKNYSSPTRMKPLMHRPMIFFRICIQE